MRIIMKIMNGIIEIKTKSRFYDKKRNKKTRDLDTKK